MQQLKIAPEGSLPPNRRELMLAELRRVMVAEAAEAQQEEAASAEEPRPYAPEPPAPDPDDDGLGDELDRLAPYSLPSGKIVWVGALSSDDYRTLYRATAHIPPPRPRPEDSEETIQRLRDAYSAQVRPYMVALCCYKAAEKKPENLRWPLDKGGPARVRAKMPGLVQFAICALSDSIAQGPDETERLRAFFTSISTCLTSWSSAFGSSEACPPGLAQETERLAALSSRAASLGKLPPENDPSGTSGNREG